MAETALREPGERGHLSVADRVVERVAVQAARQVEGVVTTGSGFQRAVGHESPRAEAHVAGQRVRVEVTVAVVWPAPLPQVTGAVRDTVRERVGTLVGMQVDAVDVTATSVVDDRSRRTRRVQ